MNNIKQALKELQNGNFVLVFDNDDREAETDFIIASQYITPAYIRQMRKDGGGLIFLMTSHQIAQRFQLPYLTDLYDTVSTTYPVLKHLVPNDIPYDTKSSFSLYINHRKTFTGITDNDRSLTMNKFAKIVAQTQHLTPQQAITVFGKEFRSPGHVPICVSSAKLLHERRGHTELGVALLTMAGLTPVGSGCEIMGNNGKALSKQETQHYAKKKKYIFLQGEDIIKAWKQWSP